MKSAEYQGDIGANGNLYPFNVAVRDGVNAEAVQLLQQTPHINIVEQDDRLAQGLLIRSKTKFRTQEDFRQFPLMMYVARVGVGVDNIDMQRASEEGVATVNTPGASTGAVAQRVVALIHAWASRIVQGTQALRNHEWPKGRKDLEPIDLSEKTLGIIGYGRIGQEVHRRIDGLMGKVLYTDVRDDVDGRVDLDDLLQQSDIVSVHVAGNGEILTEEKLGMVKPGTLIVNTARGGVMDHAALLRRMDEGVHAALDVFPQENPKMFEDPAVDGVVGHPNFIGTPHTAASDPVTQAKLAKEAATRMREFAREGTINPLDISGHTLPRVSLSEKVTPGIRGVFLHRSVPGVLQAVTDTLSRREINIQGMANEEGDAKLAATAVHFGIEDHAVALQILQDIENCIHPYHSRLLRYV